MTDVNDGARSTESLRDTEKMMQFGIVRVPADYFQYGVYRYTNLKDAIAQAERDQQQTRSA